MSKPVPYLADEAIERDVAALLAEYAQARGIAIIPPIPIEEIVEKHLKIGNDFRVPRLFATFVSQAFSHSRRTGQHRFERLRKAGSASCRHNTARSGQCGRSHPIDLESALIPRPARLPWSA